MAANLHTPFPTTGYFGPEYFCDREEETESLIRNIRGGNSTTLVALRRLGKTALVKHVQHRLRKEYHCVYADILPNESMAGLLNYLATAMAAMAPESSKTGKRVWKFLKLEKIDRDVYGSFIEKKFRDHGRPIDHQSLASILDWADGYTYYVQLLCNRLFVAPAKVVQENQWKEEALRLLREQEFVFYSYREGLTRPQWGLLKAIGREGIVKSPTSYSFTTRHGLGNPATVLRSLKTLQKKELILKEIDDEGLPWYGVYDLLFRRWIES